MLRSRFAISISILLSSLALGLRADVILWDASPGAAPVTITLLPPSADAGNATSPTPVAFYLKNLPFPRVGTVDDETLIAELRDDGLLVAVVDFSGQTFTELTAMVPLFVQLRHDLQQKRLLPGEDIDRARIFVVPAGCRLRRDVPFFVSPTRTLGFDLLYPAAPAEPVGTVLEFSCDNTDRMGNFSLDFCTDTVMPLAALAGHAAVMADHPVDAPYKGIDAMPESGYRAAAAVQTLRALTATEQLPLNDRVVSLGFSRGSGMALLLATTTGSNTFVDRGVDRGTSADVQGAVVMSGRFTYLDLLPDDKMIPRYEQAWGTATASFTTWRGMGALDYLDPATLPPLFLTITPNESPDALHQMDVLRARLISAHLPFDYMPEPAPRGHKMPIDPTVVSAMLRYLDARLRP